jgi:uncharacterized protein (DUF1800 family)
MADSPEHQNHVHLLNRITYGVTPEELTRLNEIGAAAFLEEQLRPEQIPDSLGDQKISRLKTIRLSSRELFELYPPPKQAGGAAPSRMSGVEGPRAVILELQRARLLRAVYSKKQLYEIMVDLWTNHFNVFAGKGADRWLVTSYDRDTIRPHSLGHFHDLLLATAKSPAMLFYLDNWLSVSPNAPGRRPRAGVKQGLNENYARELLELHTLGVDGGYTQRDVEEVARCFTGWTIRRPKGEAEFYFEQRMHDPGEKIVLGTRIPRGGGIEDGLRVIRLVSRHPSTARFISTKLARRLVSDNPPASLIERTSRTFINSDGNIREVIRSIVTSPEFFEPDALRAKIKKPSEFVASALRILNAETQIPAALLRAINRMGEPLFLSQPPTGFPDAAESWVSSHTLLARMNFVIDLTANRLPDTRANPAVIQAGVQKLLPLVAPAGVPDSTRAALEQTHGSQSFALALAMPEFQRR